MSPAPTTISVLEELVVAHRENNPPELVTAFATPENGVASAELAKDEDRLEKLAELAEVEREQIVATAVRGQNVTFRIEEEDGALSRGFFPLSALEGGAKASKAAKRGRTDSRRVVGRTDAPGAVSGGTASVPSVATPKDTPPPPEGVPGNIESLNASAKIKLLTEPAEGVDPRAVARYEQSREKPAPSVIKKAEELGLFEPIGNSDGSPDSGGQTPPA